MTSAQIDKDTFAIILGDLDQWPERELVEVLSPELPELPARFRTALASGVTEVVIVEIPVELLVLCQPSDQTEGQLDLLPAIVESAGFASARRRARSC